MAAESNELQSPNSLNPLAPTFSLQPRPKTPTQQAPLEMSSTTDTLMSDIASPFVLSELNTRSLLCLRSEYFRALFNGNFEESASRTSSLPDIDPLIFGLVVQWLHTDRVVFSDGTDALPLDLASPGTFLEAIKMFVFADQYDTRSLRLALFDKIASVFTATATIRTADFVATAQAIMMLPEASGLRRLLVDHLLWRWGPESVCNATDVVRHLPPEISGELIFEDRGSLGTPIRTRKRRDEPWQKDMCQYHEHLNDRERKDCAGIMEARIKKIEAELTTMKRMARRESSKGDDS
ncbi:actin binding protein [Venturia nashicola]|nr:actin binding protein [Venturia nashicola]